MRSYFLEMCQQEGSRRSCSEMGWKVSKYNESSNKNAAMIWQLFSIFMISDGFHVRW